MSSKKRNSSEGDNENHISLLNMSASLLQKTQSSSLSALPLEKLQSSSPTTTAQEKAKESSSTKSTRQKIKDVFALVVCCIAITFVNAAYSLLGPFFPDEAKKKGVTPFTTGFIIGEVALIVAILSPIAGMIFHLIGARLMVFLGLLLIGTSYILLAFIVFIPITWLFILVTILLRFLEGVGSAFFITACTAFLPALFPNNVGTIMGLINMVAGAGFALGYPLGGALYELGGFQLPFISVGILILVMAAPCVLLLRKADVKKMKPLPIRSMCSIISDPISIILFFNIVMGIASLGFFQPSLEPYLVDIFGLNPGLVSMTMFIGTLFFVLATLPTGAISDKVGHRRYFSVIGMAIIFIGCILLSIPYFTGIPQYWYFPVSFIIIDVGAAIGTVTIFPDMSKQVRKKEIKPEVFTPFLAGLAACGVSFGDFFGNFIGGFLNQFLSLPLSAFIFAEMILAQLVLILAISVIEHCTEDIGN